MASILVHEESGKSEKDGRARAYKRRWERFTDGVERGGSSSSQSGGHR